MSQRRVVITGLGQVSPVGNDVATAWSNLLAGKSGIGRITRFDASDINSQIAGEVRDFDIGQYISGKEARRMDVFIHYGIAASLMAMEDSGLEISEANADTLRRAATVHPIAALQSEWSLFSRDVESSDVVAARELGVTMVPYSPLGRGMLTGSAAAVQVSDGDFRSTLPRWQAENLDHNLALVDEVRTVATEVGATPGQVALAWLLAQGDDVVPIPGTTRRKHLGDNLGAATVTLTAAQVAELTALSAVGERYPERLLRRR